jgi:hypothetical protein
LRRQQLPRQRRPLDRADKPDDVELIVVRARALRSAPMVPRMDEFVARGRVGSERYAAEARR